MIKYKASQDLIDIFIKNGFIDTTETKRPEHFKRLKDSGYDPAKIKRTFAINSNSKNFVEFDYLMILPRYKEGIHGINMKTELSEQELKSIIAFYKLPPQTMSAVKRNGGYILGLYSTYSHVKENLDFYKGQKGKLILLDIFENIKL